MFTFFRAYARQLRDAAYDESYAAALCIWVREYRAAKNLPRRGPRSEFDVAHGVDTDGDFGGWTYLSDLGLYRFRLSHKRVGL